MKDRIWWGSHVIEVDASAYWQIGNLSIWAHRSANEWRIKVHVRPNGVLVEEIVEIPTARTEPEHGEMHRFAFAQSPGRLDITPAPPDRALVADPDTALLVPAGQAVALFVELPLWARLAVGHDPTLLREESIYRLSDTWLGPLAGEGELCYATRAKAGLEPAGLSNRSTSAVTTLRLINRAVDHLSLDGIRIPAPNLSLYTDANDRLWTESVVMEREKDGERVKLHLDEGPPPEAGSCRRITESRVVPGKGWSVSSVTSLFKRGGLYGLGKSRRTGVVDL